MRHCFYPSTHYLTYLKGFFLYFSGSYFEPCGISVLSLPQGAWVWLKVPAISHNGDLQTVQFLTPTGKYNLQ